MQNQMRSHDDASAVLPGRQVVAVRVGDGQRHRRGDQMPTRNGYVRGLLHAAGMSTVADEWSGADTATVRSSGQQLTLVGLFDTGTDRSRYWTVTTVNERGRVADSAPLKALGWDAGMPVTFVMVPAAGVIVVRRGGLGAVTRQGHLRLPADVRHGCRIRGGDRLLVVAHLAEDVLVAYTPYAIDAMAAAYHTSVPGQA